MKTKLPSKSLLKNIDKFIINGNFSLFTLVVANVLFVVLDLEREREDINPTLLLKSVGTDLK